MILILPTSISSSNDSAWDSDFQFSLAWARKLSYDFHYDFQSNSVASVTRS